jgi:ankyrin repeat protein
MNFNEKYKKYKNKYLELKKLVQRGRGKEIFIACREGNLEEFTRLIEAGADVNEIFTNQTLIETAILAENKNSIKMIEMLLERKAKINELPFVKNALLLLLKNNSHMRQNYVFDITKLLVENGVNIDEQDNTGKTSLYYAVGSMFDSVILLLLEKGANLYIKTKDMIPKTVFKYMEEQYHRYLYKIDTLHSEERKKIIKILIEKGARYDKTLLI